jgi:hypothetical protein
MSVYASGVTIHGSQKEIFHGGVITSGGQLNVDLIDGTNQCYFDFKVVFSNGDEVTRKDVNVCKSAKWTIYDNGDRLD